MSARATSREEQPAARFDHWWHAVEETFVPLNVRRDRRQDFRGELIRTDLAAVRIVQASAAGPMEVFRTPRLIRRSDPELYKVEFQTHGTAVISQERREVKLAPGDWAVADSSRPYRKASADDLSASVIVAFPRPLLPLPDNDLAAITATRLPNQQGVGALVPSFIRQLAGNLDQYRPTEAARLSSVLLDLLTTALAHQLDQPSALSGDSRDRALLVRVQAFIEEHLHRMDLSPSMIAAEHNVSLRHLYRLFEAEQATVAEWIRTRRLNRIRRDLADPELKTVPVSAIATRWGFTAPAHFSRLFKVAYGMTPTEFRRVRLRTGLT